MVVISIHALLAESDVVGCGQLAQVFQFLSTLSLRRATHGHCAFGHGVDISIHALLAESDVAGIAFQFSVLISIHALLAESDNLMVGEPVGTGKISIHALLAESDG